MNESTSRAFDSLIKVAKDNSEPSRMLWEPSEEDNSYAGLAKLFDRSDIEEAWQEAYVKESKSAWDLMQPSVQNDFIASIHRDMAHRYTGRIARHIGEFARKEQHAADHGTPNRLKISMTSFLSSREEGSN
jgi:L-serine deaminase